MKLQELKVVTIKQPTPEELQDLLFAWKVAKFVKSNAIVFCKNGMTMGVGAGQMSRLDSARIASIKAEAAKLSLQNTVVASDAFFPFRDGLDVVVDAGATCVAQPGGSMRDQEVIDAANERGVAMVFTGVRHFRHYLADSAFTLDASLQSLAVALLLSSGLTPRLNRPSAMGCANCTV